MKTLPWAIAGVMYAVWLGGGIGLSRLRFRAMWDPTTRIGDYSAALLLCLLGLLHYAPVGFFLYALQFLNQVPTDVRVTLLITTILIPHTAAWLTYLRVMTKKERMAAGDPEPGNLFRARRAGISFATVIPTLLLVLLTLGQCDIPGIPIMPAIWLVLAGFTILINSKGKGSLNPPAGGFEFPPTPLRTEIERIAEAFGQRSFRAGELLAMQQRGISGSYGLETVRIPMRRGERWALAVQLPNLIGLEPWVITAVVARRWAQKCQPGSLLSKAHRDPLSSGLDSAGIVFASLVAFLTLNVLGLLITDWLFDSSAAELISAGLCCMISTAVVLYGASRALGGNPTPYEAHKNAYGVWRDAAGEKNRSAEDYFVALAQHHAFRWAIRRPEVVLLQLSRDRALMKFLDAQGPGIRDRAFDAVVRALTEDPGRFGVDGGAATGTIAAQ